MQERLEKVKENPNLVRNSFNRAILNTDIEGLKAYKTQKNKEQKVTSEINNIKQDINDLKTLIQRILDKIG